MIQIQHSGTQERRNVDTLDGWGPEWEKVADLPDAPPSLLTLYGAGDAAAGVLNLTPLRDARWARVKLARDAAQNNGCETALGRVDTDPDSQRKVSGAVQMAMISQAAGQPFVIEWTMQDNTIVPHDAAQMIAMGIAVGSHINACHAEAVARRVLLDAATTAEEIEAVAIAEGWPGA